jgi:hypothetical protein
MLTQRPMTSPMVKPLASVLKSVLTYHMQTCAEPVGQIYGWLLRPYFVGVLLCVSNTSTATVPGFQNVTE